MGHGRDEFEHAFFTGVQWLAGYRISHNHPRIARSMLTPTPAIRVIQAHLLREAINVYHIHRFNAETGRKPFIEQVLAYLFALQFFPSTDMDNLRTFRKIQLNITARYRLQYVLIKNVRKAKHHDGLIQRQAFHALPDSFYIKIRDSVLCFQEIFRLARKLQIASHSSEPCP